MAEVYDMVRTWANNTQRNIQASFANMTMEKYIRLVMIVGAYALLRPYLMKLGAKAQTREHEKEIDPEELAKTEAAISPNSLRGQVQVPEDSESEDEASATSGANWGKKARRRQRQLVRRVLEAEEKLRKEQQEDDEDKDIQEFLVD